MPWKEQNRAKVTVQEIVRLLQREGIDPALCLQPHNLSLEQVLAEQVKVSNQLEVDVINSALSLLPPKAGYGIQIGQALKISHLGVWGLAIVTSPTVRAAVKAMSNFTHLPIALSHISFKEEGSKALFILDADHLPALIHRFMFERYCYMTVQFLQEMNPDCSLQEIELYLPFIDPNYATELSQLTGLKVISNQPYFAIALPNKLLDMPLPHTDPIAHAHFVAECDRMLEDSDGTPNFAQKIRNYMIHNKDFSPRLPDVAKSLFLSERTLRRRLHQEKHSFKLVVSETKMVLAKELLLAAALPIKVIALKLDYAESASFLRAFKKWWGVTPAQMRQSYSKQTQ